MKTKTFLIAMSIILTLLVVEIVGCVHVVNKEYNEVLNNPPDTNWIEEDLEPIFMTTGVCVIDTDDEGKNIYYTVTANGFYYKVQYSIAKSPLFNFRWAYQRHIEINYKERL